jgi:hypothetical protein
MNTIALPRQVDDQPDARDLVVTRGEIGCDRVAFHYGRKGGVIRDLSLRVRPGERIGIVGRSGAGKSTLVNLLLRFHDIEGGRITIDGRDVAAVTQESLRRAIAVVTRDTALLHRSIRDNVAHGRPEASEAEVIAALERAQAWDFVRDLVDAAGRCGLDAHAGERGVNRTGATRRRGDRRFLRPRGLGAAGDVRRGGGRTGGGLSHHQLGRVGLPPRPPPGAAGGFRSGYAPSVRGGGAPARGLDRPGAEGPPLVARAGTGGVPRSRPDAGAGNAVSCAGDRGAKPRARREGGAATPEPRPARAALLLHRAAGRDGPGLPARRPARDAALAPRPCRRDAARCVLPRDDCPGRTTAGSCRRGRIRGDAPDLRVLDPDTVREAQCMVVEGQGRVAAITGDMDVADRIVQRQAIGRQVGLEEAAVGLGVKPSEGGTQLRAEASIQPDGDVHQRLRRNIIEDEQRHDLLHPGRARLGISGDHDVGLPWPPGIPSTAVDGPGPVCATCRAHGRLRLALSCPAKRHKPSASTPSRGLSSDAAGARPS